MIARAIVAVLLAVASVVTGAESAGVRVTLARVTDQRAYEVSDGEVDRSRTLFSVRLHAEGPAVEKASSYGRLKLHEAVDDFGTNLLPEEGFDAGRSHAFHRIERGWRSFELARLDVQSLEDQMLRMLDQNPKKGFDIDVELGSPARKATKILKLSGEFQVLTGGVEKKIRINNLIARKDKPIDPQLKIAGLDVRVLLSREGDDDKSVRVEFRGNLHAMVQYYLVDSTGTPVSTDGGGIGYSSEHSEKTFELGTPVDESFALELKVLADQKMVTVPFQMQDIELP